jgi:hypothetical protein
MAESFRLQSYLEIPSQLNSGEDQAIGCVESDSLPRS